MEEKTCQYCQKQVDAKAIKCPYCQEWLNKLTFSWRNPFVIPILIILLIYGGNAYFKSKMLNLNTKYETVNFNSSHKLSISNIILKKDKGVPRLIAEIENKEPFAWDSVQLLAVYSDKNNKPIYLGSEYLTNLKAGEKRPFQVSGPCANENVSFADYDHYELKIETAYAYPNR